jgi:hypothetical protein
MARIDLPTMARHNGNVAMSHDGNGVARRGVAVERPRDA